MLEENKTVELKEDELSKASGGLEYDYKLNVWTLTNIVVIVMQIVVIKEKLKVKELNLVVVTYADIVLKQNKLFKP